MTKGLVIRAKDFETWFKANFTKGEMEDIANYGADSGFHHITYYRDTCHIYDKFHDEIWEALWQDAEDLGYDNIFAMMAGFNRNEATTDAQFKNLLVWYMAERVARVLIEC